MCAQLQERFDRTSPGNRATHRAKSLAIRLSAGGAPVPGFPGRVRGRWSGKTSEKTLHHQVWRHVGRLMPCPERMPGSSWAQPLARDLCRHHSREHLPETGWWSGNSVLAAAVAAPVPASLQQADPCGRRAADPGRTSPRNPRQPDAPHQQLLANPQACFRVNHRQIGVDVSGLAQKFRCAQAECPWRHPTQVCVAFGRARRCRKRSAKLPRPSLRRPTGQSPHPFPAPKPCPPQPGRGAAKYRGQAHARRRHAAPPLLFGRGVLLRDDR